MANDVRATVVQCASCVQNGNRYRHKRPLQLFPVSGSLDFVEKTFSVHYQGHHKIVSKSLFRTTNIRNLREQSWLLRRMRRKLRNCFLIIGKSDLGSRSAYLRTNVLNLLITSSNSLAATLCWNTSRWLRTIHRRTVKQSGLTKQFQNSSAITYRTTYETDTFMRNPSLTRTIRKCTAQSTLRRMAWYCLDSPQAHPSWAPRPTRRQLLQVTNLRNRCENFYRNELPPSAQPFTLTCASSNPNISSTMIDALPKYLLLHRDHLSSRTIQPCGQ